jgi:hypothetical protein
VTHRKTENERQLADGERGAGAKSYDNEKACSSIHHSIFSASKKKGRIRERIGKIYDADCML